jgi:cytochrome P450
MAPTLADLRLHDPEFYDGDVQPAFELLRAEHPVYRYDYESGWFYAITRHADIQTVARNAEVFVSGDGTLMPGPMSDLLNDMNSGSITISDSEFHSQLRRLMSAPFMPTGVRGLEGAIRAKVDSDLDAITAGEPFDAVARLTASLPTFVIGELLGIPPERRTAFEHVADLSVASADPSNLLEGDSRAKIASLFQHFTELVAMHRSRGGEGIVPSLLTGTLLGEPLSEELILKQCFTLLAAGSETTRNLMSFGLVYLARWPEYGRYWAADPALIPAAVEEMLRYSTPVRYFMRHAVDDFELDGTRIEAGDWVALFFEAGNRDREVFGDDAHAFVPTRNPNPHVAFGYGPHFCLGAHLARLEARVFFEELLARFTDVKLAGQPKRLRAVGVNAIEKLPLVLT